MSQNTYKKAFTDYGTISNGRYSLSLITDTKRRGQGVSVA